MNKKRACSMGKTFGSQAREIELGSPGPNKARHNSVYLQSSRTQKCVSVIQLETVVYVCNPGRHSTVCESVIQTDIGVCIYNMYTSHLHTHTIVTVKISKKCRHQTSISSLHMLAHTYACTPAHTCAHSYNVHTINK